MLTRRLRGWLALLNLIIAGACLYTDLAPPSSGLTLSSICVSLCFAVLGVYWAVRFLRSSEDDGSLVSIVDGPPGTAPGPIRPGVPSSTTSAGAPAVESGGPPVTTWRNEEA